MRTAVPLFARSSGGRARRFLSKRRPASMTVFRSFAALLLALSLGTLTGRRAQALPTQQPQQTDSPAQSGATARCRDGTYSFSKHRSGTCSHHGGVATWLEPAPANTPPPPRPADTATAAASAYDTLAPMPTREAPTCGGSCGVERWAVKTLSDPDRERVQLRPINTTVEALVAMPRPASPSAIGRAAPVEVTVYRVEATLLSLFAEADGDYHLVLASPNDPSITLIAEVPDPGCAGACASGFAGVYARARQKLMDYLNSARSVARPLVRITGVGFFDYIHGQRGVASNGIELHPVLDVEFP
jgi:hypothetical protein